MCLNNWAEWSSVKSKNKWSNVGDMQLIILRETTNKRQLHFIDKFEELLSNVGRMMPLCQHRRPEDIFYMLATSDGSLFQSHTVSGENNTYNNPCRSICNITAFWRTANLFARHSEMSVTHGYNNSSIINGS